MFRKPALTMAAGSSGHQPPVQLAASRAADKVRNARLMSAGGSGGTSGWPAVGGGGGGDLRARSSSFSTETSKSSVKERHPTGNSPAISPTEAKEREKVNKRILFHQELSETCIDFLARYMFANPAVQPKRLPTADFLLKVKMGFIIVN